MKEKILIIGIILFSVIFGIYTGICIYNKLTGTELDINYLNYKTKCNPPLTYSIKLEDNNHENKLIIAVTRHTIINDSIIYICNWDYNECYEICIKYNYLKIEVL